ncbi:MAG TPA: hypothetical protein VGO47_04390, partial [Chlamydiales bacterium]|nr:hypothetical protein [Chlamydiales bacterium]
LCFAGFPTLRHVLRSGSASTVICLKGTTSSIQGNNTRKTTFPCLCSYGRFEFKKGTISFCASKKKIYPSFPLFLIELDSANCLVERLALDLSHIQLDFSGLTRTIRSLETEREQIRHVNDENLILLTERQIE